MENKTLTELFEDYGFFTRNQINTCIPAIVDKFDSDNLTVDAKPAIRFYFDDVKTEYPLIPDIPVYFMGSEDFFITHQIQKGQECMLFFCQREIDEWIEAGGIADSTKGILHPLSSAWALFGVRSKAKKIESYDNQGMVIRNKAKNVSIHLKENSIDIDSPTLNINSNVVINGSVDISGSTILSGNVTSNGKDISDTHTHDSITGLPV